MIENNLFSLDNFKIWQIFHVCWGQTLQSSRLREKNEGIQLKVLVVCRCIHCASSFKHNIEKVMKAISIRCIFLFVVLIKIKKGEGFLLPRQTDFTCGTFQTRPSGHCMGVGASKKNSKTNDKYFTRRLNIDNLVIENACQGLRNMPIGNWEPYIIGGIVAFTAARSTMMKRAEEEDETDLIEDPRVEERQEEIPYHHNIELGDRGEEKLNFSSPDLVSFSSFSSSIHPSCTAHFNFT